MSVSKFLEAVMTVQTLFALFVVHSRFGTASGQVYTRSISDDAVQHNSQMAANPPYGRSQITWCFTLSILTLASSVLAIWLKWCQSGSKPVSSKFTSTPSSLRCKSNDHAAISTTCIFKYRAYARLHAEAYPDALSTHKSPHTVTVHGISRVASHASLDCQPDSIASNIYPWSGIEATTKDSTRLWPPELECMAQTILAHARAARVLHGLPDTSPEADSPGHACATQQAAHPSQVCTKQAVTVPTSVASTASPVILPGGNEGSSRHVQPVPLGDVLPQAADDWLKQKSQQHVASSYLLSSSTAKCWSTTDMATATLLSDTQADNFHKVRNGMQKGWRQLYRTINHKAGRHMHL
ncbi:hypothetical protein WJX77_002385 [Trebouxia sp. C0004]